MTAETQNATINARLFAAGRARGHAHSKRHGYSDPEWHESDGLENDADALDIYSAGWRVGQKEANTEPVTFYYRVYSSDTQTGEEEVVSVEAPDEISGMHILYASGAFSVESCALVPCRA